MSERAQTIFRVEKNPENPFVMIDRRAIENPKLSWKAKGLLAYLLSRPDDWIVRFRDLVKRAPDGTHTVRAALKELRDAGHVKVVQEREDGHVKQWVYKVYEVPLLSDFQQVENQQVENQQVENRTLNNNDSTKKKSTKKNLINDDPAGVLFCEYFGRFYGQREQKRWMILYKAAGQDRAEELAQWAFKKEIHLVNRPALLDSLETAAAKWKDKPARTNGNSNQANNQAILQQWFDGANHE